MHHDTIYNELKRCGTIEQYDPDSAQAHADIKRKNNNNLPHKKSLFLRDRALAEYVAKLILEDGMSIQQVVRNLIETGTDQFKELPHSRATVTTAIKEGWIPGVTPEIFNMQKVMISSNYSIRIPSWVMHNLGLKCRDTLHIRVCGNELILRKEER